MTVFVLALLIVAALLFIGEALRTRGSLIALGLAAWVVAEIVTRWPA
jgi:hypothetical protein